MALTPYMVIKGVVLRETETKEADKILTLLTAAAWILIGICPVSVSQQRRRMLSAQHPLQCPDLPPGGWPG